jgi:hypothetical protein
MLTTMLEDAQAAPYWRDRHLWQFRPGRRRSVHLAGCPCWHGGQGPEIPTLAELVRRRWRRLAG